MKLKIKETGEILEDVKFIDTTLHKITIQYLDDGVLRECVVKNLSDIEEVKDYEESKEYWYIKYDGCITITCGGADDDMKQIGNYFETKEEAEKAVEKLKAYRRLKDKGFKFRWIDMQTGQIKYSFYLKDGQKITRKDEDDLLLLFGGEE